MLAEPYKIKVVEPIPTLTAEQRVQLLENAGHNVFRLEGHHVTIDLLTDSGAGAMSAAQWSSLLAAEEAYAASDSYDRFEREVRELTGHRHVLPVHHGRAAERILLSTLLRPGSITISNGHFDTTTANVVLAGGRPVDLPCPQSRDATDGFPFKGNLDIEALQALLDGPEGPSVAAVIFTITDNAGGGHPVSLDHAAEVKAVCAQHGVPLLMDSLRFAENAHLISVRDPARREQSPRRIAEEMFRLADGAWCSMKKDAFGKIGGFLSLNDEELAARCQELLIATEGFTTYGSLAARDLDSLAQALREATDPIYLAHRSAIAQWFCDALTEVGMPVMRPQGCHAVYLDAGALLGHLSPQQLPGIALACALYMEAGVRGTEMGTLTFGLPGKDGQPDTPARRELLRLALPRRVYTRSHLDYVVAAAGEIVKRANDIPGYRILRQPAHLRHFSAELAPEQ